MHGAEQERYGDLGKDYFWFAGKRALVWDVLGPHWRPRAAAGRVIDLGCGPGYSMEDLSRFGPALGLDASHDALVTGRRAEPQAAGWIQASAETIPCRDGSLGMVVAFDVLEHLDDDRRGLQECWRVLRPGGLLVFTVPAFQWLWGDHDTRYGHRRRYRVPEMRARLQEAGFEVRRLTYCEALWVLPLWLMRRTKQWFGRRGADDFVRPAPWVNKWLTRFIASEGTWLKRWNLPVGVSIIGVARKPSASS